MPAYRAGKRMMDVEMFLSDHIQGAALKILSKDITDYFMRQQNYHAVYGLSMAQQGHR